MPPCNPCQQAFVAWMEEHQLVERMLRANLHQPQYVQQVRGLREQAPACMQLGCMQPGSTQPSSMHPGRMRAASAPASPAAVALLYLQCANRLHASCNMHIHPAPDPQVKSILSCLTDVGALSNAHLDLLWGVTEQEGTYEGVKAHIYEVLADLVCLFSAEQVRGGAKEAACS